MRTCIQAQNVRSQYCPLGAVFRIIFHGTILFDRLPVAYSIIEEITLLTVRPLVVLYPATVQMV